jgi:hypothetical protein
MATGRLAANDVPATTNTLIYTCPSNYNAFICVNMVSRGGSPSVRLCITTNNSTPALPDWIEYDFPCINTNAPLLREGLILAGNDAVYAWCSGANVSCVIYGREEPVV